MTTASLATRLRDYGTLMKPRITVLALVTTFTGSWLAAGGMPETGRILLVLLGTALGASAANTLNNYVDRDLDQRMRRTEDRCLPDGRVRPAFALAFGLLLGGTGVGVLAWFVNLASAGCLLFTIAFYIFVYTRWLKRSSPYSTEIGGIAGSMPPVIGWVAITGTLSWEAAALFAIMFIWQPPHFWALGIYYLEDYKRADIPRFPVVRGIEETKWRTLVYNLLLLPASVSLFALGMVDTTYLVLALLVGAGYLFVTVQFVRNSTSKASTMRLFSVSNLYLLVLFLLMISTRTSV